MAFYEILEFPYNKNNNNNIESFHVFVHIKSHWSKSLFFSQNEHRYISRFTIFYIYFFNSFYSVYIYIEFVVVVFLPTLWRRKKDTRVNRFSFEFCDQIKCELRFMWFYARIWNCECQTIKVKMKTEWEHTKPSWCVFEFRKPIFVDFCWRCHKSTAHLNQIGFKLSFNDPMNII